MVEEVRSLPSVPGEHAHASIVGDVDPESHELDARIKQEYLSVLPVTFALGSFEIELESLRFD